MDDQRHALIQIGLVSLLLMSGQGNGQTTQPASSPVQDSAQPRVDRPSDPLYAAVFQAWAGGSQREAERLLAQLVPDNPGNIRLIFFQGLCRYVRFSGTAGEIQLQTVVDQAPNSPEALCAAQVLKLIQGSDKSAPLDELTKLCEAHPGDPLILWAVADASYPERCEQSLAYAERLSRMVEPGPPQLHNLWANSLSMLKRNDEALVHRKIALQLEEGAWSHGALALTLTRLGRYSEANEEYAKAVAIYPSSEHFGNWAWSLYWQRKLDEAAEKYRKVAEIDPTRASGWLGWGCCLRDLGEVDVALSKFQKAREVDPNDKDGYIDAILMLHRLGRDDDADKILVEWKQTHSNPLELSK